MFKSNLIVRRIIGIKNTWQLKETLIWKDEKFVRVPKNFIFDFASVPLFFQRVFPKSGARYDRASCLHDWLYATELYSREKCDEIFYKAMKADKVPKWKAKIMFYAVRIFGGLVWRKHNLRQINKIRKLGNLKEKK